MKLVSEKVLTFREIETEDSNMAWISQFGFGKDQQEETGIFVRLQSWCESRTHEKMSSMIGKRVRITVEVIGDEDEMRSD